MASVRRGGDVAVLARLVGRLQAVQARRQTLTITRPPSPTISHQTIPDALERRIRAKLADWRGLLTRNVKSGREVLKALLVDALRFSPEVDERGRRYRFTGRIALDRLLAGVVDFPTGGTSPTGSVPFSEIGSVSSNGGLTRPIKTVEPSAQQSNQQSPRRRRLSP